VKAVAGNPHGDGGAFILLVGAMTANMNQNATPKNPANAVSLETANGSRKFFLKPKGKPPEAKTMEEI
jgi:hypothetical protein